MAAWKFKGVTEIKDFDGETLKLQGYGTIKYRLYFDQNCQLFIQIQDNELSTKSPGSHSELLFPLVELLPYGLAEKAIPLPIKGRTTEGVGGSTNDKNMSGFLKAAIGDLLRE